MALDFAQVDPIASAFSSFQPSVPPPSLHFTLIPPENLVQPTSHYERIVVIVKLVVGVILLTLGGLLGGSVGLVIALGGGLMTLFSFLECIDFCENDRKSKTPPIDQLRDEAIQFVHATLEDLLEEEKIFPSGRRLQVTRTDNSLDPSPNDRAQIELLVHCDPYLVNSLQCCTFPPKDENIPRIYALCYAFAGKLEEELFNKFWPHPIVLARADDLIRASYVLGLKTLEELSLQQNQSGKSKEYILQTGDIYYPKRALFYLSVAYHLARTGARALYGDLRFSSVSNSSIVHLDSFYQGNTFQSKWRTMYNDLVQRLHDLAPALFAEQEGEYSSWFQKDESLNTYTVPTHRLPRWFARFEMR